MTLVATRELMDTAVAEGIGIGAFNVIHLETAEGLVMGAETAGLPVILQISENCVAFHGALEPIALATLAIARSAVVPVAVHLDHAADERLAMQAVDLGFGSIMYDGAALDYSANVAATKRVAEYAHRNGVFVEAELGKIGGKDGSHASGVRTDPDEAVGFVAETEVDALAVAVGSSHAMTRRSATLDTDLIGRLHRMLSVPLVLHGSSGASDRQIQAAVRAGMTKINVSTHLNSAFTHALRVVLDENRAVVDSRRYIRPAREALAAETARLLNVFALRGADPDEANQ